jgi:hypothetical protein
VGISLGSNSESISSSVACVKEIEINRLQPIIDDDRISLVFDEEEKEEKEREEVDKLILNSLHSEMMDLGNAYPLDCNAIPRHKPSSSSKISKTSRSKGKTKWSKCEEYFGIAIGSRTQRNISLFVIWQKENNLNEELRMKSRLRSDEITGKRYKDPSTNIK